MVSIFFLTELLSPVNDASSVLNEYVVINLPSASIISPAYSTMVSLGTNLFKSIFIRLLLRSSNANGSAIFCNKLIQFTALYCCVNPIQALAIMMATIT